MREGVGVHQSLIWVAQRFAQRSLEDFFRYEHREFVIDAGATIEFVAKAAVVRHDTAMLYRENDRGKLSESQRILLNPVGPTGIAALAPAERAGALDSLLDLRTIDASSAVEAARQWCEFSEDATGRVLNARNRAIHLGDIDHDQLDEIARSFLSAAPALWMDSGRPEPDLWGDLSPIATTAHLTTRRTPRDEAAVRVVLARRRRNSALIDQARRRGVDLHLGGGPPCPACESAAALTTLSPGSADRWIGPDECGRAVNVLDCFRCGLTLYGQEQIDWAIHHFMRRTARPPELDDYLS